MEALRAETGETAYLTVWGNRGPCIVRRLEGSRETPLSIRVGYVLPLTTSATGRTFLAHLPPVLTRRLREEERERLPLARGRSEEHTSELQSLMRISYAVFCLKTKKQTNAA